MNFEFMSSLSIIRPFYVYCKDAEAYAYTKPDISGASALKAIEYIVRLMYTAAIQTEANQLSVYDMLCSPDFVIYLDDRVLLNAVHVIRRKGATAVQFGGLTQKDALEVLEQLHFVAGEVCIFLGLIDNYPVFDAESVPRLPAPNKADSTLFNQEEPTVEEAIIRQFADRLKNVDHYSQLRNQTNRFVNVHINTSKDKNTKKVNTSTNVRTSFGIITKWIKAAFPDYMIEADTRIMVLTMRKENQLIRFSVRMGCTNLGTRDMEGEWKMLPGIDYVFYCFDIDPQQEPIEQFHVFSRDEFLQMWRDLDLIILKISTTQHQKLREIYGEDMKFKADEHADTMGVQVFKTSRKKMKRFEEIFAKYPALSEPIIREVLSRNDA